jgi:ATP-binding cassette subfamily B protein/ATP-binding cassette subfamily C protein LapB
MSGSEPTLSLTEALTAALAGIGRPGPLAPDDPAADPLALLREALSPLGLEARPLGRGAFVPHFAGDAVAVLAEVADGAGWQALVPRPGGGYDRAEADGTLSPLEDGPVAEPRRVFLLVPLAEPNLKISVLPFLRRHARLLVPIVAGGVVSNLLALALPLFASFVFDKVLGNGVSETLWAMTIGIGLAILLDYMVRTLRVQIFERLAVVTEGDIDRGLFANLLHKRGALPPIGVVLDKYKQILASRDFVSSTFLLALADLPFLFLFLAAIAIVSGPLVLVPIVLGSLSIAVNLAFTGPARQYDMLARKAGELRISLLADVLIARDVVLTTALRADSTRHWRRISDSAAVAAGRARFWYGLSNTFNLLASNLAYAAVLVGGAYLIEGQVLTSGGLMACSLLTSRAMATVASVVLLSTRMSEFRRAMHDLDAILPATATVATEPRPTDPTGDIQLVNLTWRPRPDARPVLSGLDLRVRPGEIIGIAGLPGAGKTTLLRMIAGAERPSDGEALLDMHPIEKWDVRQLARSIGFKTQDSMLFEGSIESNIRAGRPAVIAQHMADVLDRSGLRHAIDRGELTLATEVGPRGSYLSGGQRHMVSLARALLGEPPLMLLDEPSTGFDSQLEKGLSDYIHSLAGRRTVLLSSHSRNLLGACTRIIVLSQGRIVTDGPRDKVLGG